MSTIRIETVPQTWNDETDTAFFVITARLFSAEFTYGAGVLLASFDDSVRTEAGRTVVAAGTSSDVMTTTTVGRPDQGSVSAGHIR